MIIGNMLLLSIIVVIIVDLSGFVDNLKSGIKYVLTKGKMKGSDYRIPPLDCSFCMTFWSNIVLLLVMGYFTIPFVCLALIIALFTGVIKNTLLLIEDIFIFIINKIENLL